MRASGMPTLCTVSKQALASNSPFGLARPISSDGEDHQPPGDKLRVFAAGKHPREVIDRRVRIAAAHRFDKSRDYVVVLFAVFIVQSDILLQTFGHVFVVNDDLSLGSIAENIDNVQQLAGVSSAETEQRPGLFDLARPAPGAPCRQRRRDPAIVADRCPPSPSAHRPDNATTAARSLRTTDFRSSRRSA